MLFAAADPGFVKRGGQSQRSVADPGFAAMPRRGPEKVALRGGGGGDSDTFLLKKNWGDIYIMGSGVPSAYNFMTDLCGEKKRKKEKTEEGGGGRPIRPPGSARTGVINNTSALSIFKRTFILFNTATPVGHGASKSQTSLSWNFYPIKNP